MNDSEEKERFNEGNMIIRDAIQNLKIGRTAYCYKDWQVEEIISKVKLKHGVNVKVEKKDGWYWLLTPVKR